MIKMLPEGLVTALGDFGSVISKFGGAILGIGVLLGLVAVGAKLFNGALGIIGKGLSVLGITTLPAYISKYAGVNKALDSFTAALLRAGTAAKTGGIGGTDIPGPGEKKKKPRYKPGPDGKPVLITEPAKTTTISEPAGKTEIKGAHELSRKEKFYNVGKAAGSVIGKGGAAVLAGVITDQISDALGRDTIAGKIADTLGTTLGMAGTGFMLGGIPGAVGLGAVGLATGVYKNASSASAGSVSGEITSQAASGDNPVLAAQLASIEQQKKQNDLMLESISEQAIANRLASMGLSKDDDLARRISGISFNA
jgi:hypothetical protein